MTRQRPTLAVPTGQRLTLAVPTGRRLTLVVPSLAFGGAERVVAKMANHWAARGEAVTVITLSGRSGDTYPLDDRVARIPLDAMGESGGPLKAITNNLRRVRLLRSAIAGSAPETVISFTDRMNVLTLLACRPLKVDTVISERIDPSRYEIGRAWSWLRRRVYPICAGTRRADGTSPRSNGRCDARPADLCHPQRRHPQRRHPQRR